jgi:methyl-accepting chemotaxis protein
MKISKKLVVSHLLVAVLPALILGVVLAYLSYFQFNELDVVAHEQGVEVMVADAQKSISEQVESALMANTLLKKKHIEDYFCVMESRLLVAKDNPFVVDALAKCQEAFNAAGKSVDSDAWRGVAKGYDAYFSGMIKANNWFDLFLISTDGYIVYTQAREPDLGMLVSKEPLFSSGIGAAFRKLEADKTVEIAVSDFSPYSPSNNEQAAFMMTRLRDATGKLVGQIAFQINPVDINGIIQQRVGLGETGESYLVGEGSDGRTYMRSDRVVKKGAIGEAKTDSIIKKAISGESGWETKTGSTGNSEFVCYAPLSISGMKWSIQTTMSTAEAFKAVEHMKSLSENIGAKIENGRQSAVDMTVYLTIGLIIGVAVIGTILALLISKSIAGPIVEVRNALMAMSNGDLDVHIKNDSADELGEMAVACKEMIHALGLITSTVTSMSGGDWAVDVAIRSNKDSLGQALKKMVTSVGEALIQVRTAVDEVSSGTTQIADASQSLSQGATESAASLEQISASATQIGQQAKSNAETATQASQLANTAKAAAELGSQRMQALNGSMVAITESSGQIAKIIKTIDDIAFQTNILALNAAVEAARAGRHGKGFAVVAEEVRSLAARSAKAARETADLIEGSKGRVDDGNRIAKETAAALAEIVSGIVKVGDLVGEMAAASNEQAQGIAQISQGLGQIDQVTQQNTATAEETAAAAEELSGQAEELRGLIGQFKLKEGRGTGGEGVKSKVESRKSNNNQLHLGKTEDGWQPTTKNEAPKTKPQAQSTKNTSPKAALPAGGGWDSMKKTAAKPASNEEIISLEDKEFGRY